MYTYRVVAFKKAFYELKLLGYIIVERKIKTRQTRLYLMNAMLHCYILRFQRNPHQGNVKTPRTDVD